MIAMLQQLIKDSEASKQNDRGNRRGNCAAFRRWCPKPWRLNKHLKEVSKCGPQKLYKLKIVEVKYGKV